MLDLARRSVTLGHGTQSWRPFATLSVDRTCSLPPPLSLITTTYSRCAPYLPCIDCFWPDHPCPALDTHLWQSRGPRFFCFLTHTSGNRGGPMSHLSHQPRRHSGRACFHRVQNLRRAGIGCQEGHRQRRLTMQASHQHR